MPGWLVYSVVYAATILWCWFVIRRLPQHVREVYELKDRIRVSLIIIIWCCAILLTTIALNCTYQILCELFGG